MVAMVAMVVATVTGCIEQTKTVPVPTAPEARQVEFFQDEIDYYEKQYIDNALGKDSLRMDSLGNIIPMKY